MDNPKAPEYPKTPHKGRYARIKLGGVHVQLGVWGSPESREKWRRVVAEYLATGRAPGPRGGATVADVAAAFLRHMAAGYRKRGVPTDHVRTCRSATRRLVALYGSTAAADFGPAQLKAVRAACVAEGACRSTANHYVGILVRAWRWAAEEELVPAAAWTALLTVRPLARGRSGARETGPVLPVDDATYHCTVQAATEPVRSMMEVQRLTGMRPGEVCGMRAGDVVRAEGTPTWAYLVRDDTNKESHAGKCRVVALGPRARAILGPLLEGLAPDRYVFRPAKAGLRKAGPRFTPGNYGKRVAAAARRAGVPTWGPNRLRHSAATAVEAATGSIDAARALLGHGRAKMTGLYVTPDAGALRDFRAAAAVAEAMG